VYILDRCSMVSHLPKFSRKIQSSFQWFACLFYNTIVHCNLCSLFKVHFFVSFKNRSCVNETVSFLQTIIINLNCSKLLQSVVASFHYITFSCSLMRELHASQLKILAKFILFMRQSTVNVLFS